MARRTRRIEVTTRLAYPVETVWEALTDPTALGEWFMETDFAPVVGHRFQFRAAPVGGWRGWVDCQVTQVEPPRRLSFTWQGMAEHSVTQVTYELQSDGDGTRVRALHEGFDRSHGLLAGLMLRAILRGGWRRMFRRQLPPVLARLGAARTTGEVSHG